MAEAAGEGSEDPNNLNYDQLPSPVWVWRKSCNLESRSSGAIFVGTGSPPHE